MNKLFALMAGLSISLTAQADYLMQLKDSAGNLIESQCVISYSYSNNLESIQTQQAPQQDIYSTEETLTNITYLGRPVYRRVIPVDSIYARDLGTFPEIDYLVRDVINMRTANLSHTFSGYDPTNAYADVYLKANKTLSIFSDFSPSYTYAGEVVIEYTKVGDYGSSSHDSYKEYTHYVLSSDESEAVVTKVINDKTVTYASGYTYNAATGSCALY